MVHIKDIVIDSMWGDTSLEWRGLDPNINIVVGQNGFGKTTMLNLIRAVLMKDDKFIKQLKAKVHINTLITNKETGETAEGEMFCDGKQDVFSFSDYRLSMLKDLRAAMYKQERIDKFFELINSLFLMTGKSIDIDDKNRVIFRKGKQIIDMEKLSAGEKQILLLLFTLFLMEDRSTVLLLDEPEISLHIEWQDRLIQLMLDLNPNCQIIMTTHSPNIFADGWEDKLVFISDLVKQ